MYFSEENLAKWGILSRNTLLFPNCRITVKYDLETHSRFVYKTTSTGKVSIFGPFPIEDRIEDYKLWKFKALIAALEGDELNVKALSQIVTLRLQQSAG